MADSEYWRLKTIERIQRRDQQRKCPHVYQSLVVEKQKFQCGDCDKLLTEAEAGGTRFMHGT